MCIASKTLYSHVYFVCTHTKYMVSGDCIPGVCTARICRVNTALGCFHTNQHVNVEINKEQYKYNTIKSFCKDNDIYIPQHSCFSTFSATGTTSSL